VKGNRKLVALWTCIVAVIVLGIQGGKQAEAIGGVCWLFGLFCGGNALGDHWAGAIAARLAPVASGAAKVTPAQPPEGATS
jgi:hypothetical protein